RSSRSPPRPSRPPPTTTNPPAIPTTRTKPVPTTTPRRADRSRRPAIDSDRPRQHRPHVHAQRIAPPHHRAAPSTRGATRARRRTIGEPHPRRTMALRTAVAAQARRVVRRDRLPRRLSPAGQNREETHDTHEAL